MIQEVPTSWFHTWPRTGNSPVLRDPVGPGRLPDRRLILLRHAAGAAVRDAEQEAVFGVLLLVLLVKRVAGHRLEAAQGEIRVGICRGGQHWLVQTLPRVPRLLCDSSNIFHLRRLFTVKGELEESALAYVDNRISIKLIHNVFFFWFLSVAPEDDINKKYQLWSTKIYFCATCLPTKR